MTDRKELFDELATALEELLAFKPASKAEVDRWYQLARKLEARLRGGLSLEVPHILWHYLIDAKGGAGRRELQRAHCPSLLNF